VFLDYIYSMNGVTQHTKPVMVGQPPMNTPVGQCSFNSVWYCLCLQLVQFYTEDQLSTLNIFAQVPVSK